MSPVLGRRDKRNLRPGPGAWAACLKAHGRCCAVCGILPQDVYGEVAKDVIHVHHLRPLAKSAGERPVDPVKDLRPVCPNCHAVIHTRTPPHILTQVRKMLGS